jgi:tetratricopeptide (TPR) repeat protein
MSRWRDLPKMPNAVSENIRTGLGGALHLALGNLDEALELLGTTIAEFERRGQKSYAAVYALYCCECQIEKQDYESARQLLQKSYLYLEDEPEPYRHACTILLRRLELQENAHTLRILCRRISKMAGGCLPELPPPANRVQVTL